MTKSVFIKTYGCQMNAYDSDRMAGVLAPLGYAPVSAADQADLIILNTCHIREKAAEKVYSELGRLRALKAGRAATGRPLTVAVAGCVAQAEGAEMARRAPVVDIIFGPQAYHRLPEMVERARRGGGVVLETDFPPEAKFDSLPKAAARGRPSAFLTVQEGCDKFCTFCVVPYTRGAEYSRPPEALVQDAARLAADGVREITLLGQNVNAYHGAGESGEWSLGRLIRRLAEIEGLARIRYTTSHPLDVDEDLIAAHREVPELMPYLHLPVQAGSDRVLAAMNRRHRVDDYHRIVERLRAARPDLALSGDFIVGFPGERDEDFAATLRLVREIGYAQAYSFKYSARPGTPAAALPDQVPDDVKAARLAELQGLLAGQQLSFNKGFEGREIEVLLETTGRAPGQLTGRSPWMQAVHLEAPAKLVGEIVPVRILSGFANSLSAALEGSDHGRTVDAA